MAARMTVDDAKAECERWFAHLNRQKTKALELGRIAAERRAGRMDYDEAKRLMRALDSKPTVYDGANLERAVRVLLKNLK
ncbi:MAG: hypothetical protein AAF346_00060 [Pseudomonadota bacterium]